ncbi:MAG: glutamine synthetase III [Candidatus Protochlamydia sp.]|nr:glutamine synthetase III [Candidatus Protochlamydia sp.]
MRSQILKEMGHQLDLNSIDEGYSLNSKNFGKFVFSRSVMQKMLSRDVYSNIIQAMNGFEKITSENANTFAMVVKEWAIKHGATHYSHWFHPLTGASAEKHDSFIDWNSEDSVIEKFNGKQLIQGEPDASSFPSGGLRSTYEARGYTGWDLSSPIFLWKAGDGITLCIPSVFFSWTGDVLDSKIPLLRSEKKVEKAALRLLRLTGLSAQHIYPTLGLEQEYFVIDRSLRNLRPDLVLAGRTVFGASSPKGQELQDHYFGTVKDRVLGFMCAFENAAIQLSIPVKTRHNEVAPAQHEVAPIFEKASIAIDHNILLMELMRQIAQKQGLACLLHEKPFAGINGSGKHCNWSLSTGEGVNLFDPSDTPHNNLHFLVLLTATLHAVHTHSSLLRASIGSASNDYRLGGHEAPPAIISIYLGQELESLLLEIEEKGSSSAVRMKEGYDFGLIIIPDLSKDSTDRNRTSPFAFTGNKFEFRGVGSSSNPAFAVTILNLIVAESLNTLLDEIESNIHGQNITSAMLMNQGVLPVLQKYLKMSKEILFSGDNYSPDWVNEAQKRGLPNFQHSPEAFLALTSHETIALFDQILTQHELQSRQDIYLEHYIQNMNIEVNLMADLFKTQILPAAVSHQNALAASLCQVKEALSPHQSHSTKQVNYLKHFTEGIEEAMRGLEDLEKGREQVENLSQQLKAKAFAEQIIPKMERFRASVDYLEGMIDDRLWPLPKYRELLFMV